MGGGAQGVLLTLANIIHEAQKERRERLKQKYGGKTQLTNTGDVPLQRQSGGGCVAETKQKNTMLELGEPQSL